MGHIDICKANKKFTLCSRFFILLSLISWLACLVFIATCRWWAGHTNLVILQICIYWFFYHNTSFHSSTQPNINTNPTLLLSLFSFTSQPEKIPHFSWVLHKLIHSLQLDASLHYCFTRAWCDETPPTRLCHKESSLHSNMDSVT